MVPYRIAAPSSDDMAPLRDDGVQARITVDQYGGGPLFRRFHFQLLEAEFTGDNLATIEPDKIHQAVAWYISSDYERAKALCRGKIKGLFLVAEGTLG